MINILNELNANNGTNYKMDVLRKYKDNKLFKRLLKMTYDDVTYTYGVSMKNIGAFEPVKLDVPLTLDFALASLEANFNTKKVTGHKALQLLSNILFNLSDADADIIKKVIGRDLKIGMGRSNINKIYKGLIVKPAYMRCGIYTTDKMVDGKLRRGTVNKVNPTQAFIQLKADGTYREFTVVDGVVTCNSRSGEQYTYPILEKTFSFFPDGKYIGELTVRGAKDRAVGNGLINSDDPPHQDIICELWDYVTLTEYINAVSRIKNIMRYEERWDKLYNILLTSGTVNVKLIDSKRVDSVEEALKQCSIWMKAGFEGAIYKDKDAVFKDGTSRQQLKLKVVFSIDVRITGFYEGKKGTKREKTFGSIMFETDDGLIKGQTSGFTDAQLEDFNSRRNELIGVVMEVESNNLTMAKNNDYWALSHPRFIEMRTDKNTTDDLQRAKDSLEMSLNLA